MSFVRFSSLLEFLCIFIGWYLTSKAFHHFIFQKLVPLFIESDVHSFSTILIFEGLALALLSSITTFGNGVLATGSKVINGF